MYQLTGSRKAGFNVHKVIKTISRCIFQGMMMQAPDATPFTYSSCFLATKYICVWHVNNPLYITCKGMQKLNSTNITVALHIISKRCTMTHEQLLYRTQIEQMRLIDRKSNIWLQKIVVSYGNMSK